MKIKFLNCKIDLSKKVFEPRIETEFWVGKAINEIKLTTNNKQLTIEVLDLFAGTGCIGIAVLKNIKKAQVDFADISKEAIEQIKINLRLNRVPKFRIPRGGKTASRGRVPEIEGVWSEGRGITRYNIYKSNLFKKIKNKRYDVIFANPPYVALDRISEVQKEVLEKDPKKSLFAGGDGMYWIEKFLKAVKEYLNKGGIFYLEFDPLQKGKIKKILEKENFKFNFYKDQFQKFRWLKATY